MVAFQNIERATLTPARDGEAGRLLARLKGDVSRLESPQEAAREAARPVLRTGVAAIDRFLPWGGLPLDGLHEIAGWQETRFALSLLARLLADPDETRPVLWCQSAELAQERGRLYGPGMAALGLDPSRFLFVTARREREALWAMEEGLTSGTVAAAIGEVPALGMTESRRLQLAAAQGGAMGLVLRGPVGDRAPGAALTRWRAEPEPVALSPGTRFPALPGPERFRLALWRCRGGAAHEWKVEQDAETLHLALAAALAGRAAAQG